MNVPQSCTVELRATLIFVYADGDVFGNGTDGFSSPWQCKDTVQWMVTGQDTDDKL